MLSLKQRLKHALKITSGIRERIALLETGRVDF